MPVAPKPTSLSRCRKDDSRRDTRGC